MQLRTYVAIAVAKRCLRLACFDAVIIRTMYLYDMGFEGFGWEVAGVCGISVGVEIPIDEDIVTE